MLDIARLHTAVVAAAPTVVGISIGRRDDRATWRVQLAEGASGEEIAAAQAAAQPVIDAFVIPDETPPRLVDKGVIVERLIAAGKLGAARAALDAAPLEIRERWNSKPAIHATDADARSLLAIIGLNPDEILAP